MLKVNIKTNTGYDNSVMVVNKSLLLLVYKLEDRSSQNNYNDINLLIGAQYRKK